jgi:predicted outer membrane repeat protein
MAYRHHRFSLAAYRVSLPAVFTMLLALALLRPHPVLAAGVVGTGTAASCTDAALNTALAGGGLVTFNCGSAAVTIGISTGTGTKTISADTTIDGGSLITISGGNSVGVFFVNTRVTFTVQNLTIANGFGNTFRYIALGGAIDNRGTLTVTNSTFSHNSLTSRADLGLGGAIFNTGTLTVTNSTFSSNSVPGSGGAIANIVGTLTVADSTFSGNSATDGGGAIANGTDLLGGGTITVANSTFSGNSASEGNGGAITNAAHCGATFNAPCPAMLTNTIIANSPQGGNCSGTITDGGHNIDDGTTCGFTGTGCTTTSGSSFCSTNPKLDPAGLANNGGPTQTIALQAGSPAVNAGNESVCAAPPVNNLDQRGYVRPGTGHTNCSIGAYEADATPPEVCVGDCGGTGSVTIDEIITQVNIALGNAQPSACPHGVPSGTNVTVEVIIQAVNNALSGCGLVCGNGSVEPGEDCDDGGTCIGSSNAGTACTAETECLGTGVCVAGSRVGVACDPTGANACPGSTCRKCVPSGGDGCAANCTTETDVPFYLVPGEQGENSIVAGTSSVFLHGEVIMAPLPLSGSQMLTVGKERDGQIPVVIKAATVHFARIPASSVWCQCIRAIAAKTCGGTWLEADGVTPSLDCTPGYTAGDSVCAGKHPCAFVHGPGNAAAGVIGCAGLDAVNTSVERDGTGAGPDFPCNSDADCAVTGTCLAAADHYYGYGQLLCAPRPPRITLTGTGGAGSALLLSSRGSGSLIGPCEGVGPGYGPDWEFCTDDDPQDTRGTVITTPLTTGTASGIFLNANGLAGNTVGPFTVAGSPLSCGALLGPQPVAATLASVLTAAGIQYGPSFIGHAVVTEVLVAGPPIPTPTITNTPTETPTVPTPTPTSTVPGTPPTRTRTPTQTRTFTPTRIFTPTRTPTKTPTPTRTPSVTRTPSGSA